jgi:hypothetical protein
MSETFVLINGAWHGGWAWRPVAQHLRAAGHRVFTPTLPGLADGDDPTKHSLDDVVDFVVNLVERNDLHDVALPPGEYGWAPRFPDRLGVTALTGPGSHEACFTRPAELAASFVSA